MGLTQVDAAIRGHGLVELSARATWLPWSVRSGAIAMLMQKSSSLDLAARVDAIDYVKGIRPGTGKGTAQGPIWQFWGQGVAEAPPIVKACLKSVEANCGARERIVLDAKSLANHIEIPGAIMDRLPSWDWTKFSDLVRLMLLEQHGGTWVDATVFLDRPLPKRISNAPFFVFRRRANPRIMANFFIQARQGHPIVAAMRAAFQRYWLEAKAPSNYFMFHYIFEALMLSSAPLGGMWRAMPRRRVGPVLALRRALHEPLDIAAVRQMFATSPVQKLTYKRAPGEAGSVWDAVCSGRLLDELSAHPETP